jgi:hypothetical protein
MEFTGKAHNTGIYKKYFEKSLKKIIVFFGHIMFYFASVNKKKIYFFESTVIF